MKNRKFNLLKDSLLLVLIIIVNFSCEREVSDDATLATFPTTAEIFTDSPIGMGTELEPSTSRGPAHSVRSSQNLSFSSVQNVGEPATEMQVGTNLPYGQGQQQPQMNSFSNVRINPCPNCRASVQGLPGFDQATCPQCQCVVQF